LALRFNADKPSLLNAADTMHDGPRLSYGLLSLPLYLIADASRLTDEVIWADAASWPSCAIVARVGSGRVP
jgi:hypothetical protein